MTVEIYANEILFYNKINNKKNIFYRIKYTENFDKILMEVFYIKYFYIDLILMYDNIANIYRKHYYINYTGNNRRQNIIDIVNNNPKILYDKALQKILLL